MSWEIWDRSCFPAGSNLHMPSCIFHWKGMEILPIDFLFHFQALIFLKIKTSRHILDVNHSKLSLSLELSIQVWYFVSYFNHFHVLLIFYKWNDSVLVMMTWWKKSNKIQRFQMMFYYTIKCTRIHHLRWNPLKSEPTESTRNTCFRFFSSH